MNKTLYMVGKKEYLLPQEHVAGFLSQYPDAEKVDSIPIMGDKGIYDIPVPYVEGFMQENPTAKPASTKYKKYFGTPEPIGTSALDQIDLEDLSPQDAAELDRLIERDADPEIPEQGTAGPPSELFEPQTQIPQQEIPETQIPMMTAAPESTQQPIGDFRDPLQHASILPPAPTDYDERGAYKARGLYNVADIAANVDRFYDKYIVSPIGDLVTKGLPEDASKKSYERLEEWSNEMRLRLPQPSGKYAAPPEEWTGYLDPKRLEMTFFESVPQVGVFAAATLANPIFGYAVMVGAEGGETIKTMENWEKETGEKVPEVYKTIAPIVVGGINGLLERYGINKILKGFKIPTNLAQRAVNAITAMSIESGTEGIQSAIQSIAKSGYAKAAEGLMDIVLNAGEQLIEDKDQIIGEAYAGLVSGGGMATATQAAGAVRDIVKKPGTGKGIEDRLIETLTEDEKQELKDAGIELKISKVPIKETTARKEIKEEQKIRKEIKKEVVPPPPKIEKPKEVEGYEFTEEEKKKLALEKEKPLEESIEDLQEMDVLGKAEIKGEKVIIKSEIKHAEEIREDIEKLGKKEVSEERETAEQIRLRDIEKDRLEAEKIKISELKEEIKEKKVEIPKYDEKSETNDALIFGLENIGNKELIPKLEAAREDIIKKMEKETDIEKKMQLATQAQLYRESKEIIEEKGGAHEFVESKKLTLEGLKEGKTKRVITEKADIAKQQIIETSESKEKGEVNLKIAETIVKRIAQNTGRTENEIFAELTTKKSKVEDVKGKKLLQASNTPEFKKWFGKSKVVDGKGKPQVMYSGHSNVELYGDAYMPKKGTAGGFYATSDPEIAGHYSTGKMGSKEYYENGGQYRFKYKSGKWGKKLWQIKLTPEQLSKLEKMKKEKNKYHEFIYEIAEMDKWIEDNKKYNKDARQMSYRGSKDLLNIYNYYEYMGYNITYDKQGDEPLFLRQQTSRFEDLLNGLGIEWNSYEKTQPGITPVFLNITNPLDTSEPIPETVMNEIKKTASRERKKTYDSDHWTKEYSMRSWYNDIINDDGNHFWATQIPIKGLEILKRFGYDGVMDVGGKGGGVKHEVVIAFEPTQIKSATGNIGKFSPTDPSMLKQETKGAIGFKDGETIIHIFENADASTMLHELFHFAINKGVLNEYDSQKLLDWTGEKSWDTKVNDVFVAHEKAARAFERYLRDGKSPTQELAEIFEKIKEWMREVYQVIKGSDIDIKLTNEVKDIFDSMLGGEKTRLKKAKVKKVPKTIRQWVQDRGRVVQKHLAEHGVSPKEDKGLFLQLAAKKGTGMPLDDLAASAIEERIISAPPSDYNPTDWLIHNLRENKKLEDIKTEAEEIVQAEMEHYYEEARNEGTIPAEMSFEQFEDANQVEFSDDIKEIEVDVLFQQQNIYEKEYIKTQALKGADATKKTGFKSLAERDEYYKKAKEVEKKAGIKDLFRTVKQTTLFQEAKPDDIADKRINREKLTYLINKKITELKTEGEGKLGLKGKAKKQLYLKYLIVQYAKQNLPPNLIKRYQTVMLMTAVKNAKTPVTVKKAFDKIDAVAREIQTRVVKANVNKLLAKSKVKKVRGKISGKYTAEAQEKLDEIRSSVKITVADAELLSEKLGDYIENKPEVIDDTENIQKLKEQLFYADFKNATLDKAERVYLEVKNLVDTGRTLRQEKEDARKERMKIIRDAVYDVLTGGKEIKSTTQLLSKVKSKLTENVKSGFLSMVGWDALMEDLSKFETGAQFKGKIFDLSNVVHDAREMEQKGLREGHKKIQDALIDIYGSGKKALRARNKDSTEKVNLGTFTDAAGTKIELILTPNQIYKKWMEMQDPTLAHLFDTMAYTDEMLDAVNKHMNNHTELKRWATWQLREFYPEYYKGVNEVFSERYGVYLPFNVNYSPISVEHPKTQGMEASELLEAQKATTTIVSGSLKKRIYHNRALKYMDGDAVLAMHISKMEHFKAYVNPLRDIQSVFYSPKIMQAIEQFHSQKANRVIRNFIEHLMRGDVDKLLVYKGWDKVRSHFVGSKVTANPTIFLKQLTSLPAFLTEINEIELTAGMMSFLSNPAHATRVLFETEFLINRFSAGHERDVVLFFKGGVASKLTGKRSKLNMAKRILAAPVRFGDLMPILVGGWAVYRKNFAENIKTMSADKAKQAALKEFTRVAQRSQQPTQVEGLSQIQRAGTAGKMLTVFMTAINQYFQLEALAIGRLQRKVRGVSQRGSTVKDLRIIAITHFVLPFVFQFATSGMPGVWDDWDEEDTKNHLFAMLLGSFNGILIAGNIVESLIQRYRQKPFRTQLTPLESILIRIDRIITEMGSDKEIKNTTKLTWDIIHSFNEVLTGLPTEPLQRLGEGHYDYFAGKDTDVRRLAGYSRYALGDRAPGLKFKERFERAKRIYPETTFFYKPKRDFNKYEQKFSNLIMGKLDERAKYLYNLKKEMNETEFVDFYLKARRYRIISDNLNREYRKTYKFDTKFLNAFKKRREQISKIGKVVGGL